ncbi:hypothetical protein DXG01_003867 [Tephrocybe rancida]|nr:hypothetical protein DXG01_003867 [Tephrocybe rancida]
MTKTKDSSSDVDVQALADLGELLITSIIADESTEAILAMIDAGAPLWYQNDAEGMSALHAAAYMQNSELAKILIDHGALWNAVDSLKNTAGDISLSFNDLATYNIIRDTGIRSELLLSLLSSKASIENSSSLVLKEVDTSAIGSTSAFLSSKLTYVKDEYDQDICLLKVGDEDVGVMMGWEQGIMERTVEALCVDHPNTQDLKVLNIGFGLGIIDTLFRSLPSQPSQPSQHVIIEPHPDVLQYMKDRGWYEKPGVTILEGKWQDYLDSDSILGVGGFDVIYTDTFSEDYGDLHQFFERLPDLLAGPESRVSFFNGLGATNWQRTRRPKLAVEGGILPAVSQAVAPQATTTTAPGHTSGFTSPRDTLSSGTGIIVAVNDMSAQSPMTPLLQTPAPPPGLTSTGLAFDEEAKLVYGVILSLRNMIKKLSGRYEAVHLRNYLKFGCSMFRDEQFVNFRTSAYKLHVYETVSGYKFVMLSDPNTESLRSILRQIYIGPFLEYVVRNPLVKMDSREYGIDNEYFRASIDRLVRGLSVFS